MRSINESYERTSVRAPLEHHVASVNFGGGVADGKLGNGLLVRQR